MAHKADPQTMPLEKKNEVCMRKILPFGPGWQPV